MSKKTKAIASTLLSATLTIGTFTTLSALPTDGTHQAQAATYTVKNGKLYKGTKLATGTVLYNDILYKKGAQATDYAIFKRALYLDGKLTKGYVVYKNRLYKNGPLYKETIVHDGKLYVKGIASTGTFVFDGILYKKGVPAKGEVVYRSKLYIDGKLAKGEVVYKGKLYKDSVASSGYQLYKGTLYYKGSPKRGYYIFEDNLYHNGKLNDKKVVISNKLYDGPKLSKGEVVFNGKVYKDGELFKTATFINDVLYVNGVPSKGYALYKDQLYYNGAPNTKKVILDNKLYDGTTLAKGEVVFNGKVFRDGELIKGAAFVDDMLYTDGIPSKGYVIYKDQLYYNGVPNNKKVVINNTLYDGPYFAKGEVVFEGKVYRDGVLIKGEALIDEILYLNGVPKKGYAIYNGVLYYNGVANSNTKFTVLNNMLYSGTTLAKGTIVYENFIYVDGKRPSSGYAYDGRAYIDGKLYGTLIYKGGRLFVEERRTLFTGKLGDYTYYNGEIFTPKSSVYPSYIPQGLYNLTFDTATQEWVRVVTDPSTTTNYPNGNIGTSSGTNSSNNSSTTVEDVKKNEEPLKSLSELMPKGERPTVQGHSSCEKPTGNAIGTLIDTNNCIVPITYVSPLYKTSTNINISESGALSQLNSIESNVLKTFAQYTKYPTARTLENLKEYLTSGYDIAQFIGEKSGRQENVSIAKSRKSTLDFVMAYLPSELSSVQSAQTAAENALRTSEYQALSVTHFNVTTPLTYDLTVKQNVSALTPIVQAAKEVTSFQFSDGSSAKVELRNIVTVKVSTDTQDITYAFYDAYLSTPQAKKTLDKRVVFRAVQPK